MVEQIRHFCALLVSRLENEFSGMTTDVHIALDAVRGDLVASDDEGEPFMQLHILGLEGKSAEESRREVEETLTSELENWREQLENLPLQKPFDIVFGLQDVDAEENLITVDSDLIFLDTNLMEGLSSDLDAFWESLSKE